MTELNAGYRLPAAPTSARDSSASAPISTSLWTLPALVVTGAFTPVCFLLFSGWRLLRWLRILPHDRQPVTDLFGTHDPSDF